MSKKTNSGSNNLMNALLYIVIGLLFCIFRTGVLNWLMTAVGVLMILFGILKVIRGNAVEGVVSVAIGAIVILGGWKFVDVVLLILGVLLIAKGVLDFIRVLSSRAPLPLISSIGTIVIGVMLVSSKWAVLDWMFIVLGILLIIDGFLLLAGGKR